MFRLGFLVISITLFLTAVVSSAGYSNPLQEALKSAEVLKKEILSEIKGENETSKPKEEASNKTILTSIRQIKLSNYHQARIEKDLPLSSARFVDENQVAFLGKSSLWIYGIKNQSLRKITLSNQTAAIKDLAVVEKDKLLIQKDDSVYIVSLSPVPKVLMHSLTKRGSKVLKIGSLSQKPTIVTTSGLYTIDKTNKITKDLDLPEIPKEAERIHIGKEFVWLYSKSDIWKWNTTSNKFQKIAKNIRAVKRIVETENRIVIQTKYALIILEKDGNIDQTIPVSSARKLVSFKLTDGNHVFLFDDKQIEFYSPGNSQIKYTQLPVGPIKKVGTFTFLNGKILTILDDNVFLYQLAGDWK